MSDQTIVVPDGIAAQRLDRYLAAVLPDLSRTRVQGLIADGHVQIRGRSPRASQRVASGQQIDVHIPAPRPSRLTPERLPLDVLFEDEDILVVDKPAGMVVHPAPGHETGTLVHALLAHVPDLAGIGGEQRPGIVHRLDKDTSGVLVVAKNEPALHAVAGQFRDRVAQKDYLAVVVGHPQPAAGIVKAPVGRHPKHRHRMAVVASGRDATTRYGTIESLDGHAYLSVHPETGRTHQIRVHLAYIGHPVAGDTTYGRAGSCPGLKRPFLHASRLVIRLPSTGQPTAFEAPLPSDLAAVLAALSNIPGNQAGVTS
ncbi:MAG: RluA family pseudouridine synthase [Dehalococcoidia bacterium]|nr:RluA family pseudouridine synthase [Dehalococcoidia bacterium]